MDEVTVKVSNITGSKILTAKVPSNVPLKRLVPALLKKAEFPDGDYKCYHVNSGRILSDDDTLMGVGVQDNDTLRLVTDVTAVGYTPIRTLSDLLLSDTILSKLENTSGAPLSMALLYTEWDLSLAEFVRANIDEIDKLAGNYCNVFVIEEPTARWIKKNEIDSSTSNELEKFLWARLDWSSAKPYDKSEAIEIARRFKIEPEELPCIIIFNSGNTKDLVFLKLNHILPSVSDNIQEDYKRFFRKLFSLTSVVSSYPSEARLAVLRTKIGEVWKSRQITDSKKTLASISKQISLDISIVDIIKTIITAFGIIKP